MSLASELSRIMSVTSGCGKLCLFCVVALPFFLFFCSLQVAVVLIIYLLMSDDETSNVLKRPEKTFSHVLALCSILWLFSSIFFI